MTGQAGDSGGSGPVDEALLTRLVDRLTELTANLDAHIAAAAARLAAPRVAAAEAAAAETGERQRAAHQRVVKEIADSRADLRRQLEAQQAQNARLRWLTGYLPAELRALALRDPARPGDWRGDPPDPAFVAAAASAAATAGLPAHPDAATAPTTGQCRVAPFGAPLVGGSTWHYIPGLGKQARCPSGRRGKAVIDYQRAVPAADVPARQRCGSSMCRSAYAQHSEDLRRAREEAAAVSRRSGVPADNAGQGPALSLPGAREGAYGDGDG